MDIIEIPTINNSSKEFEYGNSTSTTQYFDAYIKECEATCSCGRRKQASTVCTRFAFYWPITILNFVVNLFNFLLSLLTFTISFIDIDIDYYTTPASYAIIGLVIGETFLSFICNWILESKLSRDLQSFKRWLIEENQWPQEPGMDKFCICNIFNCFWKGHCRRCCCGPCHCCMYYKIEYFYHPRPICDYQTDMTQSQTEQFRQRYALIDATSYSYIQSRLPILYNEESEMRTCSFCMSRSSHHRKVIFECLENLLECTGCILDCTHKLLRLILRLLLQLSDNISPIVFIDYEKSSRILTPILSAISMITSLVVMFDVIYGECWRYPKPIVCVAAEKLKKELIERDQSEEIPVVQEV